MDSLRGLEVVNLSIDCRYSIARLATAVDAHSVGTNFCLYKAVSTSRSLAYSLIR